jgi:YihY family inner membrane protein
LLGFFLPPSVKLDVLTDVAGMVPLLDASTLHSLSGQWWALILGLVTALWSGMSVVKVTQSAFDSAWEVPYADRAKLGRQVLRAVWVLATIGLGLVLSTLITGFAAGSATGLNLGRYGRLAGYVIAIALDIGLFLAAFRILNSRPVTTKDVLPGALLSGVAFFVLQSLSSLIISRYLHNAQGTYGHFAVVITILWWFYLQSTITMFGAQLNVVLKERLYPRSLKGAPVTDADRRAYARQRIYHTSERVDVGFTPAKQP